jgi:hypothetical protein
LGRRLRPADLARRKQDGVRLGKAGGPLRDRKRGDEKKIAPTRETEPLQLLHSLIDLLQEKGVLQREEIEEMLKRAR